MTDTLTRPTPGPAARSPRRPVRTTHWSAWTLWPTAAMSWIALAQVLSFQGLVIWVVAASLITAGVVLTVARAGRPLLALVLGAVLTFGLAALANSIGGDGAGPITRSCLLACGLIMANALLITTSQPLLMLAPALAFEAAAIGLGGATRAVWLVGAWVVAAALTVAMLGPYRRAHLRGGARLAPFALMLIVTGLVAIITLTLAAPHLEHPWTIPGAGPSGIAAPPPTPPATTATSTTTTATTTDSTTTPPRSTAPQQQRDKRDWLRLILILALITLALIIVALLTWRLVIALLWLGRRRRLHRGSRAQQVVGAWTWTRLARARYDRPLPAHASPDVASVLARGSGDPSLASVADAAARVSFRAEADASDEQVTKAWTAARSAGKRPSMRLRRRVRCGYRSPRRAEELLVSAS